MFSLITKRLQASYALKLGTLFLLTLSSKGTFAQTTSSSSKDSTQVTGSPTVSQPEKKNPHWYESISLRGYVQVRYNRLLETNDNLRSDYDKSIGQNGGFLIRRARLVFSGNLSDHVYFYIQPDIASTPSGSSSLHFMQMRDAYLDLSVDKKKEFRFRIGQSKIPYGFENMQSSQNRLTLDRADALNTALPNERDLGVIFYWAPEKIRKRYTDIGNRTLKGSGDYGVFGLGVYNGQTANRAEANDNLHVVARFAYPLALKNGQIIEPGIQAYTGQYNVTRDQLSSTNVKGGNFVDRRVAASLVVYPQPLGFQMEYNIGKGPQYDVATNSIQVKSLKGGYAMAMLNLKAGNHTLIPFVKAQYYEGGRKVELDARYSEVYETEIGVEWQPMTNFELATQYTISDRTTQDGSNLDNRQHGNLLRVQAQLNF